MFSRFHRGGQTIIVRSASITSIQDTDTGCTVTWEAAGDIAFRAVDGTAEENYARLMHEELAMLEMAEARQRRTQGSLPTLPVRRGRL